MADASIKTNGWRLELDVSNFALIFALFKDLLEKECRHLLNSPGIAKLSVAIRSESLDHDWYRVLDLDEFLTADSDYLAFQELAAKAISRIQNAGGGGIVPTSFYQSFKGADFGPPYPDGTHWQAVAWPIVQIAMVPMLRHRLDTSWPFLKALGW